MIWSDPSFRLHSVLCALLSYLLPMTVKTSHRGKQHKMNEIIKKNIILMNYIAWSGGINYISTIHIHDARGRRRKKTWNQNEFYQSNTQWDFKFRVEVEPTTRTDWVVVDCRRNKFCFQLRKDMSSVMIHNGSGAVIALLKLLFFLWLFLISSSSTIPHTVRSSLDELKISSRFEIESHVLDEISIQQFRCELMDALLSKYDNWATNRKINIIIKKVNMIQDEFNTKINYPKI